MTAGSALIDVFANRLPVSLSAVGSTMTLHFGLWLFLAKVELLVANIVLDSLICPKTAISHQIAQPVNSHHQANTCTVVKDVITNSIHLCGIHSNITESSFVISGTNKDC